MPESIFEKIAQGFETQGKTITEANGYNYTVKSVYRSKASIDRDDIPNVAIIPGEEEPERLTGRVMLNRQVRVEMKIPIAGGNPSVVQEKALADIIQCFTRPDEKDWRALADSVTYTGGGPQSVPPEDQKYTGIIVTFSVRYLTLKGNPYQQ